MVLMAEKCEHLWIKNGGRTPPKRGFLQRWLCKKCKQHRYSYERDPSKARLQALALLAIQLPLDQAESLTGIKSESIRKYLLSVIADQERWAETKQKLLEFGITDLELKTLRAVVDMAGITNRCSPGAALRWDIEEWKRRIEPIIGEQVVVGTSRQGVRVCREKDFTTFIQKLKGLPLERLVAKKRLSSIDISVLRQLHKPNPTARLLSMLQPGEMMVDAVTRKPLPRKLCLKSLAEDLDMDVGTFTGIAVALVRKLRKLINIVGVVNSGARSHQRGRATDCE